MSRKIIGVTVGTQLPKPNFKQNDPTKGDYIKNKPDFDGLQAKVDKKADLIDGKIPVSQLPDGLGTGDVDLSNYYTKPETDEVLAFKADLVDGKIPASQLPIDLNADGGIVVEGVTSWNDLEDRPFYDNRLISHYSQVENPNPVSFDFAMLGYSFYKMSDLTPTREQIFNQTEMTVVYGGDPQDIILAENNIILEGDGFMVINYEVWNFMFTNKAGALPFTYNGYSLSIDVPEAGVYRVAPLGAGNPQGFICDIIIGDENDFKQIDAQYIPDVFAKSWNDLEDRPFYESSISITWDGDATGKEKVILMEDGEDAVFCMIKVQDNPLNHLNTLVGGKAALMADDGSITEFDVTSDMIIEYSSNISVLDFEELPFVLNALSEETIDIFDTPITFKAGIYLIGVFMTHEDMQAFIYPMICENLAVKQIDPKFIPANLDFDLSDYYTKVDIDNLIGDVGIILDEISGLIGE